MGRSRSLSIYLLKENTEVDSALREDEELKEISDVSELPANARMFILPQRNKKPWWKKFWGIQQDVWQTYPAALVFLEHEGRVFAITFGHAYHYLQEGAYEYDFGLLTTLNCIDKDKLKSAHAVDPSQARRRLVQSPSGVGLTFFDIDQDTAVIRALAGAVLDEHKQLFSACTGTSSVRVTTKVAASELPALCGKLLQLYNDDKYKERFSDIHSVVPVRDPETREELDKALLEAFSDENEQVLLAVPDIVNHEDGGFAMFTKGRGPRSQVFHDIEIDHYREYLSTRSNPELSLDALKNHRLQVCDSEGHPKGKGYSVYASLIFDCQWQGATYHLNDGCWYAVDPSYVSDLGEYLDSYFVDLGLPVFNHETEADYNKSLVEWRDGGVCLDKKNLSDTGETQVEPCDFLFEEDGFACSVHVKRNTRSTGLSHLFNQGTVPLSMLRVDEKARERLERLVKEELEKEGRTSPNLVAAARGELHRVIFVITTKKQPSKKSENLPLFSRMTLRSAVREILAMNARVEVSFAKSESDT